VQDIFDELHFGEDSIFEGPGQELARRIVRMIEERHQEFFCKPREVSEGEERRGIDEIYARNDTNGPVR
jgi:hypothetical protein